MLKDLSINFIRPSGIMKELMFIMDESIDLEDDSSMFEKYGEGVYRHDGFKFNFDHFISCNCDNNIINRYPFSQSYGICDNYKQVLDKYENILSDPDKHYVIGLSRVNRKYEPYYSGFRYSGWGPYIGNQNPQHEYFYDDKHIDTIYVYHIYEID